MITISALIRIREFLALDADYSKVCEHLSVSRDEVLEKIRPFLPPQWNSSIFDGKWFQHGMLKDFTRADLLQVFDRTIRHENFKLVASSMRDDESLDIAVARVFVSIRERIQFRTMVQNIFDRPDQEKTFLEIVEAIVEQSLTEPEAFEK